jgi:Trypsin-like peptidase domain
LEISTIGEHLLFSIFRIETTDLEDSYVGTGFVFEHKSALFLVTAKHVIKNMQKGSLIFTEARDGKARIGARCTIPMNNFERHWCVHPDEDIDVAVISFSSLLKFANDQGVDLYYYPISSPMLPTEETVKIIDAFEEIIFIGYSSGLWDDVNLIPITRKGITATPILIDFQGKKEFLISASVFPGSSGSPVFLYKTGAYHHRSGAIAMGTQLIFLGLVKDAYNGRETGKKGIRSQPVVDKPEKLSSEWVDLGVVLNYSTIIETIEAHFFKEKGIGIE